MMSTFFARRRPGLVLALMLACALCGASAWADAYDDVQKLEQSGDRAAALQRADAWLAAHPRDAQMKFIKANVLAASERTAEAEQLLLQMTTDYPELAEPWNNLAVLYAGSGRLEEARAALETAVRLQPDYATALENLGDVRLRLAEQAYARAQQLDSERPRLSLKLQTLRGLLQDNRPKQ